VGFWFWFAIWAVLAIGALIAFALIGYELFIRGEATFHQLVKLESQVRPLQIAMETKTTVERPAESLLDPGSAAVNRRAIIKHREQKAADRQRRLVARLKDLNIDESRFS
jgi:hypothetical protein